MKEILMVLLAGSLLNGCQTRLGDTATLKDCVCDGQKSSRELVQLQYFASLRLQNGSVNVQVDCAGNLCAKTASRDEPISTVRRTLTDAELDRLKAELEAVDWAHAAKDEVLGLDGSTVHLISGDQKVKLWTLGASTRKRRLEELQRVVETLFEYAGLDGYGLPRES